MKSIIIATLLFFSASVIVKAQTINDKLYEAISNKNSAKVAQLLKDGADANYIKTYNGIKLNMLITAVNNDSQEIIKLLVQYKADVNARDVFNTTPLMYAVYVGNIDVVKLLLNNGADVHAEDGQGNSVLSAAKEGKNKDVIKLIEETLNSKN